MGKWTKWGWGVIATIPLAAQAQADLAAPRSRHGRTTAQVLVLATVHLRGMQAGFNPASLEGARDRLAAFRPDIITTEDEPG